MTTRRRPPRIPAIDRRGLLLLLVLAMFLAPIVASAIVPDPTWIAGVYDDADGDAAILVWERTGGVAPAVAVLPMPARRVLPGALSTHAPVSRPLPHVASRAPPSA